MKTSLRPFPAVILLGIAALAGGATVSAQERDRARIPDKYKWNLADIYPSASAWQAAKEKLKAEIPQLGRFRGRLASSAAVLADALDTQYALDKELSRLYVYASMLADQDTRDAAHRGMQQEMAQIAAAFNAEASYIEPEILKADKTVVQRYIGAEPRLRVYRFYLEDIVRRAAR